MIQNNLLTKNEVYDQFWMVEINFKSLQNGYFIFQGDGFNEEEIKIFIYDKSLVNFISRYYPNFKLEGLRKIVFSVDALADLDDVHFLISDKNFNILYQD